MIILDRNDALDIPKIEMKSENSLAESWIVSSSIRQIDITIELYTRARYAR